MVGSYGASVSNTEADYDGTTVAHSLIRNWKSHTSPYRDACVNAHMPGKATRARADVRVTETAACARAIACTSKEQPFPNHNRSWQ
ncbi:hypothetical protein NDU88_008686 [Pleurodeles waltl]|uniref:Uncharacterized protein n=1 Tax=Pleurodeles waltl TaxID=8319 RepID=A0AAV7RT38_PLEWA|nr:hypothetical protein NDU88_008686 [Pleurodeles waltl]